MTKSSAPVTAAMLIPASTAGTIPLISIGLAPSPTLDVFGTAVNADRPPQTP